MLWFEKEAKAKFEVKVRGRLGPGADDLKSIRILDRIVAQDRSDFQFSLKELAGSMSSPTRGAWKGFLKLGKYLQNQCRSGCRYPYQDYLKELTVWTDTDYAGCKMTRKSTSAGTVMWGSHMTSLGAQLKV